MKHTPGPWGKVTHQTGYTYIIGPKLHESIARMCGNNHLADGDSRANAQLICAAPDLLLHLSRMVDYLSVAADDGAYDAEIDAARAVIAYATT